MTTKYEKYLILRCSNIPQAGIGLFTTVDIPKHAHISIFSGVEVEQNTIDLYYEKSLKNQFYLVDKGKKTIDTTDSKHMAKYANDAMGVTKISNLKNNSFINHLGNNHIYLTAKRNIRAGEEILVSYGSSYWKWIFMSDEKHST